MDDSDKLLINDLINIAWNAGAVKSAQMGGRLEQLRAKLKPEEKKAE